jgi:signal peptidase I
MDSIRFYRQRIVPTLAIASLVIALAGCTTNSNVTSAAPRSTVTRAKALYLARVVAEGIDGQVYAIAPSGSMLPTLDEGSIVTVEKATLDQLKRGDIVIYRNSSGMVVIHRLYERHDDRWFVLGDNNSSVDRDTVSTKNLLGRVCAIFYTSSDAVPPNQVSRLAPSTAVASRE